MNKYSVNNKLNETLMDIEEQLLETMGGDREEALSQILRYYKEFYKDPDFCIAQYGNLLVYHDQVYNFYYQHDYRCVLRMSVDKRWQVYLHQVGYVARRLLKENGLI